MNPGASGVISTSLIGSLRRHPIWRHASDAGVRRLLAEAEDRLLRPGDLILSAGAPASQLFLLLEGAARVFYPATRGKAQVTVKLFWAPAAFGDAESLLKVRWAETVEAMTPGRVLVIGAAAYFRVLQREPVACFRQYCDVARRFGVAIQSERSANLDEVEERLIALISSYAQHFGRRVPGGGVQIDYLLTQDALAEQVASNRRTVVAVLTSLYKRKLMTRRGRRYIVNDPAALLAVSANRPPNLSFRTEEAPWPELPVPTR